MFADDTISAKLMELNPRFVQAVVAKKALEEDLSALELNEGNSQEDGLPNSIPSSSSSNADAKGQLLLLRQSIRDREGVAINELRRKMMDAESTMEAYFKLCGQLVQASAWLDSWRERSVEPRVHFHVVYPFPGSLAASRSNPAHPWFEGAVVAASITTEYPSTGQMEQGTVEPPSTTEGTFFISPEGIMYREGMLEDQLRVLASSMVLLRFRPDQRQGPPPTQEPSYGPEFTRNKKSIPLSDNRVEYALQRSAQIPL
jgi:hypothetical protein